MTSNDSPPSPAQAKPTRRNKKEAQAEALRRNLLRRKAAMRASSLSNK